MNKLVMKKLTSVFVILSFVLILPLATKVFAFNGRTSNVSPRVTPVVLAVQAAAPAVVNITTTQLVDNRRVFPLEQFFGMDPFGSGLNMPREKRSSLGSGVIIDGLKGLVVTNAHVITGGDSIMVRLQDGREFPAKIRGADPDFDIAILEIRGASNLPVVSLADSSDILPGETAIAIGNPFGYNHTVTVGVISAMGRTIHSENAVFTDLIQTDAAINPGNSGGPLLNLEGRLIGINTAISAEGKGIGFAIPVNKVRRVMDSLLKGHQFAPLWLGLSGIDVDQRTAMALGLKKAYGLLVTNVFNNFPAKKAGIEAGDVIIKINQTDVKDRRDYLNILRNQLPGEFLNVTLARGDKITQVNAKPIAFDDNATLKMLESRWGITINQGRNNNRSPGIMINQVQQDSPAKFLRRGDIIAGVGDTRIATIKDLLDAFRRERLANQVILYVIRNGRAYYAKLIL